MSLLPERAVHPGRPVVSLICLGADGLEGAVPLARKLRDADIAVQMPLQVRPIGAQMKRAAKNGAGYALFVGETELANERFGLKNLETGEQVEVGLEELFSLLGVSK